MPYIGTNPTNRFSSVEYQDLTGVTGSPAKRGFTLNNPVGSANDIEVFVNNVRQEPSVAYTVDGTTTLTMTGDVETTDDFYVVFQAQAIGTATHPAGASLQAASGTFTGDVDINGNNLILDADADSKIEASTDDTINIISGGNTGLTINSSGLVIPKTVAFQVEATDTDQSYTASAYAKITWETVVLDTGSYWDTTNHRYTPQVAGWYLFGGTVRVQVSSLVNFVAFNVAKNGQTDDGTPLMSQIQNSSADTFGNGEYAMPTGMIQLNGSTDYVEAYFQCDENTTLHDHATRKSYFWGKLVHAT